MYYCTIFLLLPLTTAPGIMLDITGNTGIAPTIGGNTPDIEEDVIAAIAFAAVAAL